MRAVWNGVPESFLEQRREWGADCCDEVWDGVLHMPPTPDLFHGQRVMSLAMALGPIAARRGLRVLGDANGLYDPNKMFKNFRVPDVSLVRPDQLVDRWLHEATLVIEMLSENDEARDKFGFYFAREVREIWLIEPRARTMELHARTETGFAPVRFVDGRVRSPLLDIAIELTDGVIRLRDGDYTADV